MIRAGRRATPPPHGFALIVVLFVTTVLLIVVLGFARSMQVYATIGAHSFHDVQLRGALHAGVSVAQHLLLADLREDVDNDVDMDHLEEGWAAEVPAIELHGVSATVTLIDESGKFPLPVLMAYELDDGRVVGSTVDLDRRRQLETLVDEIGLEPDVVDVIVDWLDMDDDREPHGAETAEYAHLDYGVRNGPLASIAELELVLGITAEMVWGDPDDNTALGLADVCTVAPRMDHRVNANTAPEPVLLALVPEEDLARRIVSERDRDPFVDDADLNDRVGDSRVTRYLTTSSEHWLADISATTAHAERPLSMHGQALLRRARTSAEDAPTATPGGARSAPDATVATVSVVAWRETR